MRLPFLAATGALAEGLGPTVLERVGKSPAVGGVEIWLNSSRVTGRSRRTRRASWSFRAQTSLTQSGIVGRGAPGRRVLRE